ncbi:vegetative cell wall protein gp1-like [Eucalyptus grandis]|uniref:vegetative cell wall protein gp1-like n=1 Tax=Eucalyptus grandis TaxID=71139 RepID=UPI00192EB7A6|nr:vegetative cell wall protein gp1-like [Eucalyptus grandis]
MDPKWNDCLVGYLVGRRKLPFGLMEQSLRKMWGSRVGEIFADDQGFLFLQIPDPGYRRKILEGVPVTIARVPLILRQWKPLMDLKREDQSAIPVWIRLRNLPFECWTVPAMSAIASVVGKPLYVDQRTDQMQMVSFARICVEITANKPRVKMAKVTLKGVSWFVSIEYEWLPTACLDCNAFGHNCRVPPQEQRASGRNPNPNQVARRPARQPSIVPTPPAVPSPPVVVPSGPQRASSPPPVEEVSEQIVRRTETSLGPPHAVGGVRVPPQSEVDPVRLLPAPVSMQIAPAEDRDSPQAIPAPLPAQNHPGKKAKKKRKKKKVSKTGESSSSSLAVADQHSRGIPLVAASPPLAPARPHYSRDKPPAAAPPHPAPARKGARGSSAPPKVILSLTAGSRPPPALPLKANIELETDESDVKAPDGSDVKVPVGSDVEAPDDSSDDEDISSPESPFHPPPLTVTSVRDHSGQVACSNP